MKKQSYFILAIFALFLEVNGQRNSLHSDLSSEPSITGQATCRIIERPIPVNVIATMRSFTSEEFFNSPGYNLFKPQGNEYELSLPESDRVNVFINKICGGGAVYFDTVSYLVGYESYLSKSDPNFKRTRIPDGTLFYGKYMLGDLEIQILGELDNYLLVTVIDFNESRISVNQDERMKAYYPLFGTKRYSDCIEVEHKIDIKYSILDCQPLIDSDRPKVPLSVFQNNKRVHVSKIAYMRTEQD